MWLREKLDKVNRELLKEQFLCEIAEDYAEEVGEREEGGREVRGDEMLDGGREEVEGSAGYLFSPVSSCRKVSNVHSQCECVSIFSMYMC